MQIPRIFYDSLPNYVLSFFVSNSIYVDFNIARKFYSILGMISGTLTQVLDPFSVKMKSNFIKYLRIYYTILILIFLSGIIIFFFIDEQFLSIIFEKKYINSSVINYCYIYIILNFIVYLFLSCRKITY